MRETIAIIGAGIGGLAMALALKNHDVDVLVVERDPEPVELDAPDEAFERWPRPGVPQFRHAHIMLARLQTLVRDQHPELHAELLAAGLELSRLEEMLPPGQLEDPRPLPGDEDLRHFWGRRATFEYVLRKHVGKLPRVRFLHSTRVDGLLLDASGGAVRVRGLRLYRNCVEESLDADLIIDCSGKRTQVPDWLKAAGARIGYERFPSNYQYVCRHYRLNAEHAPLVRQGTGANLDFFGYSTFYGEHGHYAITLGCPTDEKDIARAMRRADGFDAVCAQIPVLTQWISESKVESKVLGAARTVLSRNSNSKTLDDAVAEHTALYVKTAVPKTAGAGQTIQLPGTLQGAVQAPIAARAAGYVKSWNKDIGSRVEKGDVLAELDAPELDQQVSQAKAVRDQTAATVALAQTTVDRWDALRKKDVVAQQDLDERRAALVQAKANLAAADANLQRLQEL